MSDIILNGLSSQNELVKEPTGFPASSRTNTTLTFIDGTRTFTIAAVSGTFDYYIHGLRYSLSTASIVIPNVSGMYIIYLTNTGVLGQTTSFDDTILADKAFTATVYWNASTATSYNLIADERHGLTMDWATHKHLHNAFGTRYYRGFGINYTLGDGSLNTHAEIALAGGTIADEDLVTAIVDSASPTNYFEQILSPIAKVPMLYHNGSSAWVKDTAINAPLKTTGSGRLAYNNSNVVTEATDNYYVAVWVFALPLTNQPIIAIMGTRQDATLTDAQVNNTFGTIDFGVLPAQEFKVLFRLIYQTSNSFVNSYKAALTHVQDLRTALDSALTASAAVPVGTHSSLIGLTADDHPQYHNDTRGDLRYPLKSVYVQSNGNLNYQKMPYFEKEDLASSQTGTTIPMTASNASGGSIDSTILQVAAPDWNASTNKLRTGLSTLGITAANNSRSSLSTNNSYRIIVNSQSSVLFAAVLAFTQSSIDFTNDPVFCGWGLLSSFAAYPTAANGVYFRCPRVGESNFLRACIMQAGVETVFVTTLPYDSTNGRWLKTEIAWNPSLNQLVFTASDNTTTSVNTVSNVATTYPTLVVVSFGMGVLIARNGNPIAGLSRSVSIDKIFRMIDNQYNF